MTGLLPKKLSLFGPAVPTEIESINIYIQTYIHVHTDEKSINIHTDEKGKKNV